MMSAKIDIQARDSSELRIMSQQEKAVVVPSGSLRSSNRQANEESILPNEQRMETPKQIDLPHGGPEGSSSSATIAVDTTAEQVRTSPCFCGRGRRRRPEVFGGNPEALGWCLDSIGRTLSVIGMGAFLMPALLTLAYEAAGCEVDANVECDAKVYGIRPGSLLTLVHTIVSVGAAPLMPLMGSILDHTSHRLTFGRVAALAFLMLLFLQVFVSQSTWFALSICLVFLFFVFIFQMVAAYSYLPELTSDEQQLNSFSKKFTVYTFVCVVLYIASIVGVSGGLGIQSDTVLVARIAISTVFVIAACSLFPAWGILFQKRPPLHELPPGQSVWSAGFWKLYHSCQTIWKHYRALKWFYLAVAFCDGAIESLMTILITFSTSQLQFTSMDTGVAVLIMLMAYIPAGFLSAFMTRRFNPIRSTILSMILMIVMISLSAGLLYGPDQQPLAFVLNFFLGLSIGWKWTTDRLLSVAIIPEGQSAEYMGIYLCFGAILTWAPPLLYTLLNEAGVSQRIGLASLNIFFLIGLFAYCMMGTYSAAVEAAGGVFSQTTITEASSNNGSPPIQSQSTLAGGGDELATEGSATTA